jgi:hypothetical protein
MLATDCSGGLAFLWCLWRYRSAAVLVDDEGVTQRVPFGERRLAWSEVTTWRRDEWVATLTGRTATLRIPLPFVGDAKDLLAEIERRAPSARAGTGQSGPAVE